MFFDEPLSHSTHFACPPGILPARIWIGSNSGLIYIPNPPQSLLAKPKHFTRSVPQHSDAETNRLLAMPTRFALQGWLPRLFRGWWILGSRKRSSLIISPHLSPGTCWFQPGKRGIDSKGPSFKHGRGEFSLWQVLAHWFIVFFGDVSAFFWFRITEKKIQYITKTQKGITDIFCWLTFSFISWKFHKSIRVIFHGLSLVNMLLLSDASRVLGKNHLQPTPPELAEERQRKTPHTSVSRSVFWVHPTSPWRKRCWESRISPSDLLYPWTFDSQFKHISTTTTMPCDYPGKLRSWVAERVNCLSSDAKGGKKNKNKYATCSIYQEMKQCIFFKHLLYVFTCGKNAAKVLFLWLWIKSPYISDCFFL